MTSGRVIALGLASTGGAPIEAHSVLDLVPGVGVVGDRYALGEGTWQDWPDREVTLVEAETAEAIGLDALLLRRNIVTRGIRLDALIGRTFRVGTAVLVGVRACDPCRHLERIVRPGLKAALEGRGGLRARVFSAGRVRVGDAVLDVA